MGMNIHLRSPKDEDKTFYNEMDKYMERFLNRAYNAFVHGPEATGENCEFNQIQKLYDINLSPLRFFNYGKLGVYWENVYGELDWKLYNAKSEEEKEQLKEAYKPKFEAAKKKSEEEYKNKWIATSVVKDTVLRLMSRLMAKPELLDEIQYSMFFNKEVFNMEVNNYRNQYYIKEDFEHILKYIAYLENKGINKMAFYLM